MKGPENRACHGDKVSGVNRIQVPRRAEKVQAAEGEHRTGPGGRAGFSAQENAENGSEHHVQTGDKTGVTGGGKHDPELLKNHRDKQTAAGGQ